jgi:hypothetical protein
LEQGKGLWGCSKGGAVTLGVDVDQCLTRMPGQWLRSNHSGIKVIRENGMRIIYSNLNLKPKEPKDPYVYTPVTLSPLKVCPILCALHSLLCTSF